VWFPQARKWCMADLTNPSDLKAATNRNRIDSLQTELELCFTFTDIAKTERQMGDRYAARRVLEKAEAGYATIARFLTEVKHANQKSEVAQKLAELRARLEAEQDCLKRHGDT
jgi:hypothetical protein